MSESVITESPADDPHVNAKVRARALGLIFFTVFLDILGFGILVPVIPFLVKPFDASATIIGLLTMSYSIAQFLAAPILGRLSDRFGRRPVLMISIFGAALAYMAFGLAGAVWVFFAARIVDGLTGGNISIAQAYIADVSPLKDRAKNFGLIGAAFGAGFVFGPAIGGIVSHISLSAPAYLGAFLCLLSCAFAWFYLPESLPRERRITTPFRWADFNPFVQLHGFIARPELTVNFLALLMLGIAMNVLRSNFSVYARDRLHFDPSHVGYLYAYLGVMVVITQAALVRHVAPKLGDRTTALVGFGGMIAGFAWMATSPGIGAMYAIMPLIAVGQGLCFPAITAMSSHSVGHDEQGGVLGAQQSVNSFAMIVGPLMAGWAFDAIGPGAPYAISVGCLVLGLVLALGRLKRQKIS